MNNITFIMKKKIKNKPQLKQNNTKTPDPKIPQKERKNRKMIGKILPQEQVEKSEHRKKSQKNFGDNFKKTLKDFCRRHQKMLVICSIYGNCMISIF